MRKKKQGSEWVKLVAACKYQHGRLGKETTLYKSLGPGIGVSAAIAEGMTDGTRVGCLELSYRLTAWLCMRSILLLPAEA